MENKLGNNTQIWSTAIDKNGYLNPKYGVNGDNTNNTQFPSYSFDLEWEPILGAKTYALLMQDFDTTKITGFPFIHWTVLNIKKTKLEENESYLTWKKWIDSGADRMSNDIIWQGYNSTVPKTIIKNNKIHDNKQGGILPEVYTNNDVYSSAFYFGPYPADKDHLYTLYVYGLDIDSLDIKFMSPKYNKMEMVNRPYYVGDFIEAINDHVIDMRVLNFKYKKLEK